MSPADDALLRAAAVTLANDRVAASLIAGLRGKGLRGILLKGASLRRLAYDPIDVRPSGDVDLLVEEGRLSEVEEALPELGFRYAGVTVAGAGRRRRSVWVHEQTGIPLELHTSLTGAEGPPARVWSVLAASTEVVEVGGLPTEVLGGEAAAMHLALNVAHHGRTNPKTMADLDRALTRIPSTTWADAAALAARIDALPAFAAGVRLDPRGEALLDELDVDAAPTTAVALRAETAPPLAQGLEWLARLPSMRARLAFVVRTVFPPVDYMRVWAPSARSRLGLTAAYCWRPFWMAARLPVAVRAWRRARRSTGG